MKSRQDALEQQTVRTEDEKRELGQLRRRLANYKRIERVQLEIQRLTAQKIERLRSSPREKATILATFGEKFAQQQEELIALIPQYKMILGGEGEWEKLEKRIVKDEQQNLIKFIYVVTADGRIVVDEEKVRGVVSSRAAHSELAQGGNVYGAGELIFCKHPTSGEWILTEINNGSGHYRPSQATLPYVKKLIERNGISTHYANLEDSILRGGPVIDMFQFG
jgi:hypothetical protein